MAHASLRHSFLISRGKQHTTCQKNGCKEIGGRSRGNRENQRSRRQATRHHLGVESLESRELLAVVTDWEYRGVGGGGSLFGPSLNPHDDAEIYISSDMSQIFHTDNGGASWETVPFRALQGGDKGRVLFTNNPMIQYAIDGRPNGPIDQTSPSKTIDGGKTWTQLPADPTGGEVFNLFVDYNNPNRLLIGSWNTMYVSTDGGATFQERFSTESDAGLVMGGVFFDQASIYVATEHAILTSTDNGQSFQTMPTTGIPNNLSIVSFAGAREGSTTRFYAIANDAGNVWNGMQGSEHWGYRSVYRYDVGDASWTKATTGIAGDDHPFYVATAINDIDTVYMAGGDDLFPVVYKSTNGGVGWNSVLETANNANVQTGWSGSKGDHDWWYGGWAMGFGVDVTNPDRAIITDLGFAHITTDGGATWRALNVIPEDLNPAGAVTPKRHTYQGSGLENTTAWDLTWASPDRIIASQSDISGTVSDNGGMSWSFDYTGHNQNTMYDAVVHKTTGVVYAATSTIHDMYQSTRLTDNILDAGEGRVLFSTNQGHDWETLHDFGRSVVWVATDPNNDQRLYASVVHSTNGGIYVSNDIQDGAASTWTRLSAPPRTEGHAFNIQVLNDGTLVASYSARRDGSGAFTASSGVFISADGGASWSDRSHRDMRYWTKDIVIDPHDPSQNTWYAGVWSGWGGPPNDLGGLFRTTNRGQTWERIFTGHRISSVTIDPVHADEMYMTTEVEGLWFSANRTAKAPVFEPVTNYPFRQPERVVFNPYDQSEVWVVAFGGSLHVGRQPGEQGGDFNSDGNFDCSDLDAMIAEIASANHNARFDLTSDGQVTIADRDAWLAQAGAVNLPNARPYALGDANLDGTVDALDQQIWSENRFTTSAKWCTGDFTADGRVDVSDFNMWNDHRTDVSAAAKRTGLDDATSPNPSQRLRNPIVTSANKTRRAKFFHF